MTAPDPGTIVRYAKELVADLDAHTQRALVDDQEAALAALDISVVERFGVSGCDLDASWNRRTRTITIASDASPGRKRFSCLHEFGHERLDDHVEINNWLYGLGQKHSGPTAETVCDAFAAELLLPQDDVAAALTPGFKARHVVQLFENHSASREAVCVRAAQHLGSPGLVVLARGSTVLFSSNRSLPFRIGRGVDQPQSSVITRASSSEYASTPAERVQLRKLQSFTDLTGDAVRTNDGYTFAVLRQALDEVDHHGRLRAKTWTCGQCRADITDADWCNDCRRRICPDCGCQCPPRKPEPKRAVCQGCYIQLPVEADECPTCGHPVVT